MPLSVVDQTFFGEFFHMSWHSNLLPSYSCCRWVIDNRLDRHDDDDVADLIMLIAEYNQPPTYIHSFQHLTFLQIFQIFHLLTKWLASSFFNIILINYFFLQLLARCQYSSHRLIQALRKLCSIFLLLPNPTIVRCLHMDWTLTLEPKCLFNGSTNIHDLSYLAVPSKSPGSETRVEVIRASGKPPW